MVSIRVQIVLRLLDLGKEIDLDLNFHSLYSGNWKVFTGNELAALFGWWMFDCWRKNKSRNADVKNIYMLATTVSSKILKAIALKEGFHFEVRIVNICVLLF